MADDDADFTIQAKPEPPRIGGAKIMASVMMFSLSDEAVHKENVRTAWMMLATLPSDPRTCKLQNGATLVDGGRTIRFDCATIDKDDQAAKKGLMQRARRFAAGHYDLTLGSWLKVSIAPNVQCAPIVVGKYYRVDVTEVLTDKFKTVESYTAKLAGGALLHDRFEATTEDEDMLLAAAYHGATQLMPLYRTLVLGGNLPIMPEKKEFQALTKDPLVFTEDTREFKVRDNLMPYFPNISAFPDVVRARQQRGMPAVLVSDPGVTLTDAKNWPNKKITTEGKEEQHYDVCYTLTVAHKIPTEEVARMPLPLTREQMNGSAYAKREMVITASRMRKAAVGGFYVYDLARWPDMAALPYYIVGCPAVVRMFTGTQNTRLRPAESNALVQMDFVSSGGKEEVSKLGDTSATLSFPAEGIMNTGYPISQDAAMEILTALGDRPNMKRRYNKKMSTANVRKQPDGTTPLEANPLSQQNHPNVLNLLESFEDVTEMSDAEWWFLVVPNTQSKSEKPETIGYKLLRKHMAASETEALRVFGQLFLDLVKTGVSALPELGDAFRVPGARPFDFLLWAVRRSYATERAFSPLSTTNHIAAMRRAFARVYPADLSDMPDAAVSSGAPKRGADADDDDADMMAAADAEEEKHHVKRRAAVDAEKRVSDIAEEDGGDDDE